MSDSKKPITLTENAAKHIASEISRSTTTADGSLPLGLKIGIKISGCSGYAYVLDWITQDTKDLDKYLKFTSHDINIYVDEESYKLIAGTQVDYIQQGISRVMVFKNPNATAECGCGESFTINDTK